MSYELQGILTEIFNTDQVTERFKKREFVIEKTEESGDKTFTETIKFQLTNDKCDIIDPYATGEEVKIHFNIKGRKWEKDGKTSYFINLEAWRIEKVESSQPNTYKTPPPENDMPF